MMRLVIGVSGKARSGKDHLASILARDLGLRRVGFADLVKEAACFFLPWREGGGGIRKLDRRTIEEWKTSEKVPAGWCMTMRQALIMIGDRFRDICPTTWIDEVLSSGDDDIVVPDIRYRNELDAIATSGNGFVVRVVAPNRQGAGSMSRDRSETELDEQDELWGVSDLPTGLHMMPAACPFNAVVVNGGSLAEFDETTAILVGELRTRLNYCN